nr:unnamed protein product [Saccharomyces cerevisiae]
MVHSVKTTRTLNCLSSGRELREQKVHISEEIYHQRSDTADLQIIENNEFPVLLGDTPEYGVTQNTDEGKRKVLLSKPPYASSSTSTKFHPASNVPSFGQDELDQ